MIDKMIVLADLGRVKAYRVTYDMMTAKPRIDLAYDCEFPEAHWRVVDVVTDQSGAFPKGRSGTSIGENHNMRVETERRLIRLAAEKIAELVEGQRCWYMAATEYINARLTEQLNPGVRSTLYKNLPADLVKIPKQHLLDYFMATV